MVYGNGNGTKRVFFFFFHISLQSADDRVLSSFIIEMNTSWLW